MIPPNISEAKLSHRERFLFRVPFVGKMARYFPTFYYYAGKKLYVLIVLALLGAVVECFGLSMMLPILDFDTPGNASQYTRHLYEFLENFGVRVSMVTLLLLILIAFVGKGVLEFIRQTTTVFITSNLTKSMRLDFAEKYNQMTYEYYTNTEIGHLNNIVTTETNRTVAALSNYIELIVNCIVIGVFLVAACVMNWAMTLVVIAFSGAMFMMLKKLSVRNREFSLLLSDSNAKIQSLFIQTLSNFKYLKATSGFAKLFQNITHQLERNRLYTFRIAVNNTIPRAMIEPVAVLLISALIFYHVSYQGNRVAEIIVTLAFVYKAFSRLFGFQLFWQKFSGKIGSVEVVERQQQELSEHKEKTGEKEKTDFTHTIKLQNVSFRYESFQVLSDINLVIPRNKCIGIVGESGAGKTTLFDILTGLITPQSGDVMLDGERYQNIKLSKFREQVGYVTQDPVVFNDTIAANISMWDEKGDVSLKKIEKAAQLANCAEFIQATENGYEAILGDQGVKLSGGQRQRIAIARELYKEPQVIIFDEATSSLDTQSESVIKQSIDSLMGTLTIVIIAHRLSTIKNCDYIYVLSKGAIIEEGTYAELSCREHGSFSRMCQAQQV